MNGDFSRKSQNFPTPVYFASLLNGFPLELGTGARGKKKTRRIGPRKKFDDIFSGLDTMHQRDRWTDGQTDRQTNRHTDTGRQQRPRLRIASRGKKTIIYQLLLPFLTHMHNQSSCEWIEVSQVYPSLSLFLSAFVCFTLGPFCFHLGFSDACFLLYYVANRPIFQ